MADAFQTGRFALRARRAGRRRPPPRRQRTWSAPPRQRERGRACRRREHGQARVPRSVGRAERRGHERRARASRCGARVPAAGQATGASGSRRDGSDQRTVRTVLAACGWSCRPGVSGARLNVQTRRRRASWIPAGGTTSAAAPLRRRAWVATGYGFAEPRAAPCGSRRWSPRRAAGTSCSRTSAPRPRWPDVSARCLERTVTAKQRRGHGSAALPASRGRPGRTSSGRTHADGSRTAAARTSSASRRGRSWTRRTRSSSPPAVRCAPPGAAGRSGRRAAATSVRTFLVCLARGSGFG